MSDKDFLVSMFTKLGEENFKRLVTLTSEKCISELGLGTSENCKQDVHNKDISELAKEYIDELMDERYNTFCEGNGSEQE